MTLATLISTLVLAPTSWYGPVTVQFDHQVPGNPYDATVNDLRVRFTGPGEETRLAFYDDGVWKAVLVARNPGTYQAQLIQNGSVVEGETTEVTIRPEQRLARGFLRIDPATRRFRFDDGTWYFPVGYNLGWQTPNLPDITADLAWKAENGINWTRVWACHWDGKNPFVFNEPAELELGWMIPTALDRWQQIVDACERHGVRMQFVLFHHGLFSTRVNPNWDMHPWNTRNGGFLENPMEFFVDPLAKKLSKNWLRYAVARYGHSPGIMAWEIFNEVEWVDSRNASRWGEVTAWHRVMSDYLRSIDPHNRLVTTSSIECHDLYASADFWQPHVYPQDVWSAIYGAYQPADKPTFFGEFGPGATLDAAGERLAVRDGLWAGVFAGHAGAGQYWFWDRVHQHNLMPEFRVATRILEQSGFAERSTARPYRLRVSAPVGGDLTFSPAAGWTASTKFDFNLPQDATAAELLKLSGFFQSQTGNNRALQPEPLTLRFRSSRAGTAQIHVGSISAAGAHLEVTVNGRVVLTRSWPGGGRETPFNQTLEVPIPAGQVAMVLTNRGADWFTLSRVTIPGVAPQATVHAIGDESRALVRVRRSPGAADVVHVGITGLGIHGGPIEMVVTDLDTGTERTRRGRVARGTLVGGFTTDRADQILSLRRH